jgi:non-heme chloroperoxidase
MSYISVGKENSESIDIYYEDHGSGSPVLMIHGFPLSGRAWEKQAMALLRQGYRVITYDRRGFGRSSQTTIGYDYDTFAEDMDKLITGLDLHDVTLVGHSMGGGEVARYIGKFGTSRVNKAVIVSGLTPHLLKTSDNPSGLDENAIRGFQGAIAKDRPAYLTAFFKDFYNVDKFLGNRMSEEALRDSWNIASKASPVGTFDCPPTWVTDFRKDLGRFDVPTLILHGDADRILPLAATAPRTNAMIKGSQLVVLEGAPHGMAWTHADEVNQALIPFLAGKTVGKVAAKAGVS